MPFSRREFVSTAVAGTLSLSLRGEAQPMPAAQSGVKESAHKAPIIICAGNGYNYLDEAYKFLVNGGDTLEAAIKVVTGPEDDPHDTSVGYGGLPNEDGVVELDACCMHGPTRRAGSVGALHNVKNAVQVAKAVMEHTGHVMLVSEGADRFAKAMGFPQMDLLTEHSRKIWMLWKEYHSTDDWWGPGLADPHWQAPESGEKPHSELWEERLQRLDEMAENLGIPEETRREAIRKVLFPPTGTIHCSALNDKGEISGCTTTSGLAYKMPGRVGDSPIIGAGCYTDPDIGSAGATGSGEENIKVAGAHTIIENMRHGMPPHDAGMDALKRVAKIYDNDMNKLRYVDMTYYVLRKDGAYAGVSLWEGYEVGVPHKIAVHDGTRRAEKTIAMFQGPSVEFPPFPKVPPERMKEMK
ncbi:MAG TPA: N(4)-(beta-N-acetylglucosaminyl)-L-asparaginase [Terriglobales bacterium]|nr:N(4)-(beta-N-acetylglucosaminyl)-L-asparaginase [Terriglobales bacterium]